MLDQNHVIDQEICDFAALVDDLAERVAENQPGAARQIANMMRRASSRFDQIAQADRNQPRRSHDGH